MPNLVNVVCHHCQKPFQKPQGDVNSHQKRGLKHHYCSRVCAVTVNRPSEPPNPVKQRKCKRCGEGFVRTPGGTRTNCPKCRGRRQSAHRTIGDMDTWANGKSAHPSWRWGKVRADARYHNQDLCHAACAICGYDKHVELDHIKEISSFPVTALLTEVNARDNLIQLCRNCHWERGNGLITDEQLTQARAKSGATPPTCTGTKAPSRGA